MTTINEHDAVATAAAVAERDEMLGDATPLNANADGAAPVPSYLDKSGYIHPDSMKMLSCLPFVPKIPVFGKACSTFGPKMTIAMGVIYLLNKGIADGLETTANYPLFVDRYGLDVIRYNRLSTIGTMGWSIKALTAMLCDTFACMGFTKRWYMFVSGVLGAVFALIYGLLPAKQSSANTACAFVFLSSYCKANIDILSEGHYSRRMRLFPDSGPSLVSWIWWMIMLGGLISAAVQGPLSDGSLVQVGIFISAGLQLITAFFFLFNFYGEGTNRQERLSDDLALRKIADEIAAEHGVDPRLVVETDPFIDPDHSGHDDASALSEELETGEAVAVVPNKDMHPEISAMEPYKMTDKQELDEAIRSLGGAAPVPCLCGFFEMNKEVATRNWRILTYSAIMTCAVVAMTCGEILADTLGLLIICVIVSVVCCLASFWALPLLISKVNVFGYLQMVFYIQLPGALNGFYLASPECLPDAPHFSYTFYNTISSVIGNVAGLAGVTCFPYIFAKHGYRLTVTVTTIVQIIASIFDIIIVQRWNTYIGIPDHAMYICGDAVVFQVCYYLAWMPVVILLSHACPRGSESMVYALLAGFSNLGQSTSAAIGSIIMEYRWPILSELPCDFHHLAWLVTVGHVIVPLLIIPTAIILLPSARICDTINLEGEIVEKVVEDAVKAQHLGKDHEHDGSSNEPVNEEGELAVENPPTKA